MKKILFPASLLLLLLLALWGHWALERLLRPQSTYSESGPNSGPEFLLKPNALNNASKGNLGNTPQRIVSLAPSLTETLFALNLGPEVVGVTQFCAYPAEAALKPKVAGFSDVYLEALIRTRPNLVVLPMDKTWNRLQMERLGLPALAFDTRTIPGLMHSIEILGQSSGHPAEAAALLEEIRQNLAAVQAKAQGRERPRVLFSVMHAYQGLGYISEISVIGNDGFYSELIKLAGGKNAYQGRLPFPRLSREAIIFLDPEVIIDIIPPGEDLQAVRRDWQSLSSVSAIKNNRLLLLNDEAHTVPGPRFVQTLQVMSQEFHPGTALGTKPNLDQNHGPAQGPAQSPAQSPAQGPAQDKEN